MATVAHTLRPTYFTGSTRLLSHNLTILQIQLYCSLFTATCCYWILSLPFFWLVSLLLIASVDHSLSGDSYQDAQGQYSRHHEEEEEEEEETFIHYKDNKHHRKEGRSKDSRPKRPSSQPRPGQQPPRHQKKDPRSGLSSRGTAHLPSIAVLSKSQNRQDTDNMPKTRKQDQLALTELRTRI